MSFPGPENPVRKCRLSHGMDRQGPKERTTPHALHPGLQTLWLPHQRSGEQTLVSSKVPPHPSTWTAPHNGPCTYARGGTSQF